MHSEAFPQEYRTSTHSVSKQGGSWADTRGGICGSGDAESPEQESQLPKLVLTCGSLPAPEGVQRALWGMMEPGSCQIARGKPFLQEPGAGTARALWLGELSPGCSCSRSQRLRFRPGGKTPLCLCLYLHLMRCISFTSRLFSTFCAEMPAVRLDFLLFCRTSIKFLV